VLVVDPSAILLAGRGSIQPIQTHTSEKEPFHHERHDDRMVLVPGQQVVWIYRPQQSQPPPRKPYAVAAEVVQVSTLRVRIRVRTASGTWVCRWVHPKNLHARALEEPAYLYPEPS
jgi:hypothetical protein